jgi:hypothetical protein
MPQLAHDTYTRHARHRCVGALVSTKLFNYHIHVIDQITRGSTT